MSKRLTIKYLSQDKHGYWRYERRVPRQFVAGVGQKVWKYSLGKDAAEAERRAQALRVEHDSLIANAATPEGREAWDAFAIPRVVERTDARITEGVKGNAPALEDKQTPEHLESPFAGHTENLWRNVPSVLALNEETPPAQRLAQLTIFQALAFGNADLFPAGLSSDPRPAGRAGALQFDAYKAMLTQAIADLQPKPEDESMKVTALMDSYIKKQRLRAETARSYRQMVRKLVDTFEDGKGAGNQPLHFYTKARLQKHRDRLADRETISTQTIEKAFAPLKALWRWAAEEYEELSEIVFPPVRMPRPEKTVEETRWQSFTDAEIKKVWGILNAQWGPDSASRLSQARRADFLMAVRVMLYTGLRPIEVFRLNAASCQDGVLSIRETKTTARKIPLCVHLEDLPEFLAKGGFEDSRKSGKIATTLSDNFRDLVRPVIGDDRKVLYSLKDTLVERLQRLNAGDDVIRGIIGHKSGQGKLRHYKTPMGDTAHGLAMMKAALDQITYW